MPRKWELKNGPRLPTLPYIHNILQTKFTNSLNTVNLNTQDIVYEFQYTECMHEMFLYQYFNFH